MSSVLSLNESATSPGVWLSNIQEFLSFFTLWLGLSKVFVACYAIFFFFWKRAFSILWEKVFQMIVQHVCKSVFRIIGLKAYYKAYGANAGKNRYFDHVDVCFIEAIIISLYVGSRTFCQIFHREGSLDPFSLINLLKYSWFLHQGRLMFVHCIIDIKCIVSLDESINSYQSQDLGLKWSWVLIYIIIFSPLKFNYSNMCLLCLSLCWNSLLWSNFSDIILLW